MKTITQYIAILIAVLALILTNTNEINAQCSNFDYAFPAATQSTTSNTLVTVTDFAYAGNWASYNVTNGETYTWTTCGDSDFDTQLTLWNTAHTTSYAYNDDDCGTQSTITWTATFTGQVDVLVNEYNCSNNSDYMTVQWACTSCGINISNDSTTTCSTNFYDSGGPGSDYSDDETFVYTICPDVSGNYVIANFTSFDIEYDFDFLTIYDGNTTSAPEIGTYTGTPGPGLVGASRASGCLTFEFISDGATTAPGWVADISCTATEPSCSDGIQNQGELGVDCGGPCPASCPVNMSTGSTTTCSTTFYDSGGAGNNYSDDENFVYTICPDVAGNYVIANFTTFNIEDTYDFLTIYDGNTTSATEIGIYTGTTGPGSVQASGASGCLTFEFISDGATTAPGWVADITCTAPEPSCSDGIQNQGELGVDCGGPCPACTPANDLCSGATNLPCGTINLAGTTVGSTSLSDQAGCASSSGVWYSFVGDGQSTTISSSATFDHEMVLYSGSCGSLTNVACKDGSTGTENYTFTPANGVTYYVYIAHWSTSSSTTGTFTISRTCANDIIPTVCANDTYTLDPSTSANFYDDGGSGGDCNVDEAPGNFANAGCETITTICAAPGEYLIADFSVFSMFNTDDGFDWMVIYEGPSASGTILFDNRSGAVNNPVGTDCNYAGSLNLCAIGRCLTFRFNGTSVVSREGWDAVVMSVPDECAPLPVNLVDFNKPG